MKEPGKPRENYSIVEAVNWYSYTSNNPVRYVVDPSGRAEIYSRKMDDRTNDWLKVGNIFGFKHYLIVIDLAWSDQNAIFQFSENGISQYESSYHMGTTYEVVYSNLDDDIAYQAVKNILATEKFEKKKYVLFFNDCKDFTDAVMKEYESLWRKQETELHKDDENFDINDAWDRHYAK